MHAMWIKYKYMYSYAIGLANVNRSPGNMIWRRLLLSNPFDFVDFPSSILILRNIFGPRNL